VSLYQKGKTNLDFTEARDSEWQWHQLGYMQVCTSLQRDNHASTPPLSYAMHTIKITPNLLFEYQCRSGKFIRLPNPIEKNRFGSENRIKTFFVRIGMLYSVDTTPV